MVRRRLVGAALFAGAAAGATALGYAAERRLMGTHRPTEDPEWAELHRDLGGRERRVASFDGTGLHVVELGPAGAPTIVLAHGYGLGSRSWHYQLRDLSDELRVVAWDQRGHGRSARAVDRNYAIDALGRDLDAVLEAVLAPGERAVVAGHSMGGMTVMAYAQARPHAVAERLAGAALVGTGASRLVRGSAASTGLAALSVAEQRLTRRLRQRHAGGAEVVGDLSFLLTRAVGLNPDAADVHVAFVEQLLIEMPREAKAAFAQTLGSLDVSAALAHLTVPTLVVVGDRDRLTPPRQARALVEALPDPAYVELPGLGHHPQLEDHEAVTRLLREHVRACLPVAAARPGGRGRRGRPAPGPAAAAQRRRRRG
jgi:pimeloyl-ACP methyl ester carboxylesterase